MGSLELIDVEGFHLNEFIDDSPNRGVLEVVNIVKNYMIYTLIIL